MQYTALAGRQDIIRQVQDLGPESLTLEGWTCTVRSGRDWECLGDGHERLAMVNGTPVDETLGARVDFVPYCLWTQVQWHDATVLAADDLPWDPGRLGDDFVFALTGCDPALPVPWLALVTRDAPTAKDVVTAASQPAPLGAMVVWVVLGLVGLGMLVQLGEWLTPVARRIARAVRRLRPPPPPI